MPDYRGNYCGPWWSDGKWQESVIGKSAALSDFDATCKEHDASYALHEDLKAADYRFFRANFGVGVVRTVAGLAVGLQGLLRPGDIMSKSSKKSNLRGSQATKNTSRPSKASATQRRPSSIVTSVPAAYGYSLQLRKPVITRNSNVSRIVGSDFAGTVYGVATSSYAPAATVPLNPAYYVGAMLGSLSRAYEKFRFVRAVVQYIPSVPTSAQGQVVMTSTRSIKEPFLDGSSASFLGRALSTGNAVATPVWREESITLEMSPEWLLVDPLIDADLDDCIAQEVQVYAFGTTTAAIGILLLHYEIEFTEPLYTFHSSSIPVPIGIGTLATFLDNTSVNAVNDAIGLTTTTVLSLGFGSIYRMVFRQAASTLPTGVLVWSAAAKVATTNAININTIATATTAISMVEGTTLYGVLNGSDMVLYSNYDGAMGGATGGALLYNTATTAAGTWSFLLTAVRLGAPLLLTNQ